MRSILIAASVAAVSVGTSGFAATNLAAPPVGFDELRAVIQTNLPGVTKAELDRHGVEGLLQGFRGKVRLLDSQTKVEPPRNNISRSTVYDGGIGYVRVPEVFANLNLELVRHCQALDATNKLKGVVLDLRFADGEDYAAAAAVADLFVANERDLLDWGKGMARSTVKANALTWPVVVLVNGETAGAAEALAALLRETSAGLILGNRTIGAAMTSKEFELSNGQRLRIATEPVKLAGDTTLPLTGLTPDIEVNTPLAEDRIYWNDPYAMLSSATTATNTATGVTNRVARRVRTTEADLVRARRQGLNLDEDTIPHRQIEPEAPVIRDPALGRAVDLLKGLAVVRRVP